MRARAQAACLRSAVADLHEQLGRHLAEPNGTIRGDDGRQFNKADEHFRDLQIDDFIRPVRNIPTLPDTPEVAALRLDWEQTEAAAQEAWERFKVHHNPKQYRAEMALISGCGEKSS